MAVRLPVVLSQSERRTNKIADYEESWVAQLLFEARLDATLISSLSAVLPQSTDQLCLEGIKGDFLLLTWLDKESVLKELSRLEFQQLEIVPVDGSSRVILPIASSGPKKKVYWLQLDVSQTVVSGLEQVKGLLQSLSTPVFQLKTSSKEAKGSPKREPISLANSRESERSKSPDQPITFGSQSPESGKETSEKTVQLSNTDTEFPNIDILMSELDELDL